MFGWFRPRKKKSAASGETIASDEDDLYEVAAFYFANGIVCESCEAQTRNDDHPTPLPIQWPSDGCYKAMAAALRAEGWLLYPDQGASFGVMAMCPECAIIRTNGPLP